MEILSLGCGVQSSCLFLQWHFGEIDFDYAVFADTGAETTKTMRLLERFKQMEPDRLIVRKERDLSEHLDLVPFYNKDGSQLGRYCTGQFKTEVVRRALRSLGIKKCNLSLGISVDESIRMKPSRVKWITHKYPLIDMMWTRQMCREYNHKNGWLIGNSACAFCPYIHEEEFKRNMITDKTLVDKAEEFCNSNGYKIRRKKPDNTIDMFNNLCDGYCNT